MKKFKNFVIGGIQSKIFNLVMVTILLIIAAYTAVLFYQTKSLTKVLSETTETQKANMASTTNTVMKSVVENTLTKDTAMEAYIADNMFSNLESQVKMIGDYATKLYADPDLYQNVPVQTPDQINPGELSAQLVLKDGLSPDDPGIADEIGNLGNLGAMMTSLYDSTNISACFISTDSGVSIICDDRPEAKLDDNGVPVTVDGASRPWYKGAVAKKGFYFTDIEVDYFTGKIGIECSLPIYKDGKIVAVVGADLFLDSMQTAINSTQSSSGFTFIVSERGHVIFSPVQEGIFKVEPSEIAVDLRTVDNSGLAEFTKMALVGATDVREIKVDDKLYYMSGAPIATVGWALVDVVDTEATKKPSAMMIDEYQKTLTDASNTIKANSDKSKTTILVLLIAILVLGTANALVLAKRIVSPLNKMSKSVTEIKGSNLDFEVANEYKTGDEIEVLANSFSDLSQRTKEYIKEITRVTAEKERIGAELNVATQIQADMLPRLFPAFPERKEFDLYAAMNPAKEVGGDFYDFFLLDDDHLVMVMADVSGKGVPAALFMVIAKTLIKNRCQLGGTPSEILKDVNSQLCEGNEAGLFVTVWMAILTISTGEGIAANAGHEHPAVKRAGGRFELVTYKHSPALATVPGMKFREHTFKLEPGDQVFVYTDGVTEATDANNKLFGTDRLVDALNAKPDQTPAELLHNVTEHVEGFVKDAPQFDDITMLCLTYNGNKE